MPNSTRIGQALVVAAAAVVIWMAASPPRPTKPRPLITPAQRHILPEVKLTDLDGQTWRLEDHRSRVTILNFWATWCPPCREETPGLIRLAKAYDSRTLTVAGISMDSGGVPMVRRFINQFGVPYPVLMPLPGFALADQVENLPTTLLLDSLGRVAQLYIGAVSEDIFHQDVERLLKEGA